MRLETLNFSFVEKCTNHKVYWYWYRNTEPKNIDYCIEFGGDVIGHHYHKLPYCARFNEGLCRGTVQATQGTVPLNAETVVFDPTLITVEDSATPVAATEWGANKGVHVHINQREINLHTHTFNPSRVSGVNCCQESESVSQFRANFH